MRKILHLFPVFTIMLGGCASAPVADLKLDERQERMQIQHRLKAIFEAAEKKEMARLDSYHLYGPKFTKFSGGSLARQDAAAGRKGEHAGLASIDHLSMQADKLKIDIFGDVAIATFVLRYSFNAGGKTIAKQEASTIVFVKERGSWKITHEHFSPSAPNPS